jgi:site-specific DNA recombinase
VNSIITQEEHERLREMMEAKDPKRMPPRVVTGDVLLTGLVTCPECGGGMTTSTGKGGRYRYYACSNKMRTSTCKGRRVPMEEFDALVVQHINDAFLTVENIDNLLQPLRDRQDNCAKDLKQRLAKRETEVQAAKKALDNLYAMVQAGFVELDDPDFKERFLSAKEVYKRVHKELEQVTAELKWSGKFGQRAKMYPTRTNGYEDDKATELFRQV